MWLHESVADMIFAAETDASRERWKRAHGLAGLVKKVMSMFALLLAQGGD